MVKEMCTKTLSTGNLPVGGLLRNSEARITDLPGMIIHLAAVDHNLKC